MDTDTVVSLVCIVVALAVCLAIVAVARENRRREQRRERVRDYHRARLAVLPHRPAAVFNHGAPGWRAACSHDGCIDTDAWLVHDDPFTALDDACSLISESIHGPSDPKGTRR